MKNNKQLFNKILNESIQSKADELTEKIMKKVETNEDIDTFDLEVGQEYDYKKSDDYEPKRVIYKGKVTHGGKFENTDGEKIILSKNLINKMINKVNENQLENEIGEGNKFTGELAKAKKAGKTTFKVDGKTYKVEANEDLGGMEDSHPSFGGMNLMNPSDEDKETLEKYLKRYIKRDHGVDNAESLEEGSKFIQKATEKMDKKGSEGKFRSWCKKEGLASEQGEVTMKCIKSGLKSEKPNIVKMANFAKNIKGYKSAKHESVEYEISVDGNDYITLNEDELVNMIEELVMEEKVKGNLKGGGKSKGMTEYDRISKVEKKQNSEGVQMAMDKMKKYVKDGSKAPYNPNPEYFPKGNGELGEMAKKAYRASDAVEEYIENFAYSPGMENLKYDEIEPNDEWLSMNIEGSEKTGNSGKYANAVETGLGKKINKKRKENLYQKEVDRSYKRVKQPVDTAGEDKKDGKLDKMFSKLGESVNDEKEILINEEMSKMKQLISYSQKTQ
jgi:hypothetical protein